MIGARSHSPNCLRAELQKSLKIKQLFGAVRKRTLSRPLSGRRGGHRTICSKSYAKRLFVGTDNELRGAA